MYNLTNNKQLSNNRQYRIGSHKEQHLLFSLVHPILCYANTNGGKIMKAEFTAIIESAPEGGYWAICPEVPGANGQGETVDEAKENLRQAIELILQDRREDIL